MRVLRFEMRMAVPRLVLLFLLPNLSVEEVLQIEQALRLAQSPPSPLCAFTHSLVTSITTTVSLRGWRWNKQIFLKAHA